MASITPQSHTTPEYEQVITPQYDWVIFIGRVQPPHNGHVHVWNEAKKYARKGIIIFVGSVNGPRNPKNPFTFKQRKEVVEQAFWDATDHYGDRELIVLPVKDYRYSNTAWLESIQEQVKAHVPNGESVKIIGYKKDASSAYIDWFPQWGEPILVDVDESSEVINATDIRDILFENKHLAYLSGVLPAASMKFMEEFKQTAEYARLKEEHEKNQAYKKSWANSPFPPMFVTVDSVVTCAGHVLMIQRGDAPGKGQWALPGGYLNTNERIVDGAIRELKEETEIDISERALKGLIRASEVFDSPSRDSRGRVITHAFYFVVDTFKGKLPKVRGADDAADAKWIPLADLDEDVIFSDHYDIITKFIGTMR